MANTPLALTRARQKWARERGGAVFFGKALTHPTATEEKYRAKLDRLIATMRETTEREFRALWTAPEFAPAVATGMDASLASQSRILANALSRRFKIAFGKAAPSLAEWMLRGVNRHATSNLNQSLKEASGGLTLKTSVIDRQVFEAMKATVAQNVDLIKSIPDKYFTDIQGAVMRGIQEGKGMATVLEAIQATGAVTERRAALIARDQTSKAVTALNKSRLQKLGVRKFRWLHSGSEKQPRELHKRVLNGNVYDLDDPPEIDEKTGERGLPGQLINCKCRMVPVIDFGGGE